MQFTNNTRVIVESVEDDIPIIHGKNYYIDEQGFICTYNKELVSVFDRSGANVQVSYLQPVTEFIYIINHKVAYKTTNGFLVTDLVAEKEKYVGGFQGIAGFNETETSYEFMNANSTLKSGVSFTARINNSKQLEIYLSSIDIWVVPLGEFRCFIGDTLYTINYDLKLPNSFGDTFTVTLLGWTTASVTPGTNYIRDLHISGNTLFVSCRLNLIGSEPYNWSNINTTESTVIWSEDTRIVDGYLVGDSSATNFYVVNYNTSYIYWVSSDEISVLQEYQHKLPILGVSSVDKFSIAIVDKESLSMIVSYVSLNTWLMKIKLYLAFNQMSAYEEVKTNYLRETVEYVRDLDAVVVNSTQRAPMIIHILNNKVTSVCHTNDDVVPGEYSAYLATKNGLYHYTKVEDSGEYDVIDRDTGILDYDSFIYIGSDLEPDVGGSTLRDTEILFEGKLAIVDGDEVSVESSGDTPIATDLPIRTEQVNPDNWWYLYSKTLRYPISYTDWIKISMMPTTKIFNIRLVNDPTQIKKTKKRGK